jgi:hypothetical protein
MGGGMGVFSCSRHARKSVTAFLQRFPSYVRIESRLSLSPTPRVGKAGLSLRSGKSLELGLLIMILGAFRLPRIGLVELPASVEKLVKL